MHKQQFRHYKSPLHSCSRVWTKLLSMCYGIENPPSWIVTHGDKSILTQTVVLIIFCTFFPHQVVVGREQQLAMDIGKLSLERLKMYTTTIVMKVGWSKVSKMEQSSFMHRFSWNFKQGGLDQKSYNKKKIFLFKLM